MTIGDGEVQYFNPKNPKFDHISTMPGDPDGEFPSQRVPYVRRFKDSFLDKYGNKVGKYDESGHIPWSEYTDFKFE